MNTTDSHKYQQEQINDLIVAKANRYGHVVRLKGGDPFVFGRGSEELEFAQKHHIETEVIRRRYTRGLQNLFSIYLPLANETLIFDSTTVDVLQIAYATGEKLIEVFNFEKWEKLKEQSRLKS